MPSIFPWNKSAVGTPKSNNSPASSKPSSPPPADKKPEQAETSNGVTITNPDSVKDELLSPTTNEKVPETPSPSKFSRRRTAGSTSNKKKASPQKPASVPTPASDKPEKKSKRLSAKLAATPKIKAVAIPDTPERAKPTSSAAATPKKKNQVVNFVPGSLIEAQNFDGKWIPVKVVEVDMEDREVLVRSCDKSNKTKSG